jgi:ketosteroid isomerase-like protein
MATTTTAEQRAATVRLALELSLVGDAELLCELYTEDVRGWSPAITVSSRAELAVELEERAGAFTEVEVTLRPIDIVGDRAYAEWIVSALHSGPFVIDDDTVLDATGRSVSLRGITIAEFRGSRIKAFRQYWDEAAFFQSLGVLPHD